MEPAITSFFDVLNNNEIHYSPKNNKDDLEAVFEDIDKFIYVESDDVLSPAEEESGNVLFDASLNGYVTPVEFNEFMETLFRDFTYSFIQAGYKNDVDRCNGLALKGTYAYNDLVILLDQIYPRMDIRLNEMIGMKIAYAEKTLGFIEKHLEIDKLRRNYNSLKEKNFYFVICVPDEKKDKIKYNDPLSTYYRICHVYEYERFRERVNSIYVDFVDYLDCFVNYNSFNEECRRYVKSIIEILKKRYIDEKKKFQDSELPLIWKNLSTSFTANNAINIPNEEERVALNRTAFANLYAMSIDQVEFIDKIIGHLSEISPTLSLSGGPSEKTKNITRKTYPDQIDELKNVETKSIANDKQGILGKESWTVNDVALFLGVKSSTIYQYTSKKKIPHYKLGKNVLFKPKEIQAWLNDNKRPTLKELKDEADRQL